MNYTKKQFFKEVMKEAKALKKELMPDEKQLLNIERFNPANARQCIYGQIGMGCRSGRSVELITKCCIRFFKNGYYSAIDNHETFTSAKQYVNGTTSEEPTELTYISSIEAYIVLPEAKNENLIAYLKDETKKLVL